MAISLTQKLLAVSVKLTVADVDGDAVVTTISAQGTKGVATVTDSANSVVKYTPNEGAIGLDSFTVLVNDGGDSGTAAIVISIDITNWQLVTPTQTINIYRSSDEPIIVDIPIPSYYLPSALVSSFWDAPTLAHTSIDLDYKFTGYDWLNREITWSLVTAPSGATMGVESGVLSWVPVTQGSFNFTIRMTVDSQNYDRSFACVVDNSKCSFVSLSGSDANTGTLASPFLTLEAAANSLTANNAPKMIYIRGGDYAINDTSWYSKPVNSGYRNLAERAYQKENMLIIRNYPSETPKFSFTGSSSGFIFNQGANVQGFELSGGNISEHAVIRSGKFCVHKKLVAKNYSSVQSGNCTGIKLSGGSLVDSCLSFDNFDRTNLTHHNSSNWLFYGTQGEGETFIIDSISAGFSVQGFKIKHAGSVSNLHIHRCVSYGTLNPYAGAQNGCSIRHSLFYKNSTSGASANGAYTFGFAVTDPETSGANNLSVGMLCDNNLIISDNTESQGLLQATYVGVDDTATPCYYSNNTVQVTMALAGAAFTTRLYNAMPPVWRVVFDNNKFITPTAANAVILSNAGSSSIEILNTYGSDNIHTTTRQDFTFSACGSAWFYDESTSTLSRDGVPV